MKKMKFKKVKNKRERSLLLRKSKLLKKRMKKNNLKSLHLVNMIHMRRTKNTMKTQRLFSMKSSIWQGTWLRKHLKMESLRMKHSPIWNAIQKLSGSTSKPRISFCVHRLSLLLLDASDQTLSRKHFTRLSLQYMTSTISILKLKFWANSLIQMELLPSEDRDRLLVYRQVARQIQRKTMLSTSLHHLGKVQRIMCKDWSRKHMKNQVQRHQSSSWSHIQSMSAKSYRLSTPRRLQLNRSSYIHSKSEEVKKRRSTKACKKLLQSAIGF